MVESAAGTVAEEGARVFRDDVARVVGLLREALPALDDALLRAKARGAITRCCTHDHMGWADALDGALLRRWIDQRLLMQSDTRIGPRR